MKKASSLLCLLLLSCNPALPEVKPALENYLVETKADTVFVNQIKNGSTTQMVYALGKTTPDLYKPLEIHEQPLVDQLYAGCLYTKSSRISMTHYRQVSKELGIKYLILCPIENGYVGGGFSEVPDLQALPVTEELATTIDGYL